MSERETIILTNRAIVTALTKGAWEAKRSMFYPTTERTARDLRT